jgi:hypothetical protein
MGGTRGLVLLVVLMGAVMVLIMVFMGAVMVLMGAVMVLMGAVMVLIMVFIRALMVLMVVHMELKEVPSPCGGAAGCWIWGWAACTAPS